MSSFDLTLDHLNFIMDLRGVAMNIQEKSIVIVADGTKENFLRIFRENHSLFDISVLELKEFKKKYYFDYTEEAVYRVHKKYGVIKDIAEIYLENIYYINEDIKTDKTDFLKDIKDYLDANDLLIYDPLFKRFLNGKTVVLYKLGNLDKFYERTFENLKKIADVQTISDEERPATIKLIYKLPNRDAEVAFVASQIAALIKSGISIDHIKLANVQTDYIFPIAITFKDFKIPIELPIDETIASTLIFAKFREFYSANISETLKKLSPFVKSSKDEEIYKSILSVLNAYYWAEDYMSVKEFIFDDLKKVKMRPTKYKHAVRTIDFLNDEIGEDDHVFLINFNQGSFPKTKKDEDYLDDETKRLLGISDSIDLNKKMVDTIRAKIESANALTVSYATRDLKGELYLSNAYDEKLFEYGTPHISFEHSDDYNRKVLLACKDENKKYGTTTDTLETLLAHYKEEPYMTFDNAFKGIDPSSLREFLENKLTLSYSSMDEYYKCSFRYYLGYILKVDKFEDSFATVTGTIFHEVLSKCYESNFDFGSAWTEAIQRREFEFKNMERFYLDILKEELEFIIGQLHRQLEYSDLKDALFEQKIVVPFDEQGNVVFKGFIDKIIYDKDENVAAIVDYKTGHPELNLDNIFYGLDMQLPVYAYLLKHFSPLKDATIGGFYLQKIINNQKEPEAKCEALKLQGYTNSNPRILGRVDKTYESSSLIKSMRKSKDKFYSYSKILNDSQIDKMVALVEERIRDAVKNIMDANFQIDPKSIGGDNKGCKYCKFKDVCYMKNENIKILKQKKKEDFLGGEEDGLD